MTPMMSSSLLTTPLASCRVYARFLRSLYIWTGNPHLVLSIIIIITTNNNDDNNNEVA